MSSLFLAFSANADSAAALAPAVRRLLPAVLSSGTLCLSFTQLHPPEDLCQSGCAQRPRMRLEAAGSQPGL